MASGSRSRSAVVDLGPERDARLAAVARRQVLAAGRPIAKAPRPDGGTRPAAAYAHSNMIMYFIVLKSKGPFGGSCVPEAGAN